MKAVIEQHILHQIFIRICQIIFLVLSLSQNLVNAFVESRVDLFWTTQKLALNFTNAAAHLFAKSLFYSDILYFMLISRPGYSYNYLTFHTTI